MKNNLPLAIVGLDPGTTTAYVLLGLKKEIVHSFSGKELGLNKVISQIIDHSRPLIVGTDKAKTPSFVEEFSRKTGAVIISPPEDLGREEKRLMLVEMGYTSFNGDEHEKDCLAAALYAYRKIATKLEKIDAFIKDNNLEAKRREFTKIALKENLSFQPIKEILTKGDRGDKNEESFKIVKEAILENKFTKKDHLVLFKKIRDLQSDNYRLNSKLKELEKQFKPLEKNNVLLAKKSNNFNQKVDSLFLFKEQRLKQRTLEVEQKTQEIVKLKDEILRLNQQIGQNNAYILIKKLEDLGTAEFEKSDKNFGIKAGDILWINNPEIHSLFVLEELKGKNIRLISEKKFPAVLKNKFQTANLVKVEMVDESKLYLWADSTKLEEKFKQESDIVDKVVQDYKKQREKEY
ncbi:DUF460 domain-containing protein [Candidatus Woesearchaeota archaeon]|nr:DUF460 domain-containing protein [Candidatus Woesearchaeota archaeon]